MQGKQFQRPLVIRAIVFGLCGALITLIAGLLVTHSVKATYQNENVSELAANAKFLARSFDNKSRQQQSSLKNLAESPQILNESVSNAEKQEVLGRYAERNGLVRAGIAELDGTAHSSDGGTYNALDRDWFIGAVKGESVISANLYDRLGTGGCLVVFSVPLKRDGEVKGVLFATEFVSQYLDSTQIQLANLSDKVWVINDKGTLMSGAEEGEGSANFFTQVKARSTTNAYKRLRTNLAQGQTGNERLFFGDTEYQMVFAPITQQDGWYVLIGARTADLDHTTARLLRPLYRWVIFATFAGFIAAFVLMLLVGWLRDARARNQRLRDENHLLPENPNIKSKSSFLHDIDEYSASMEPDELALVGVLNFDALDRYDRIFSSLQLEALRKTFAAHVSRFASEECNLAYAGSNTYLVFARGFYSRKECRDFMLHLHAAMTETFEFKGFDITLKSQAGAKIYYKNDESARSSEDLLDCAYYAYGETLKSPDAKVTFYDYDLQVARAEKVKLRRDLPSAVARDELLLMYQPVYELATKKLVGFEALVRWKHPEFGVILPAEFLPLAIESGDIIEIGRWVVAQVCADAQRIATPRLPVSFNVAAMELLKKDYSAYVEEQFNANNLKPHMLTLELTDENISVIYSQVNETILRLKSLGINVCLDSFGWSVSETPYLAHLPVDCVKIGDIFNADSSLERDLRLKLSGFVHASESMGLMASVKGIVSEEQEQELLGIGFTTGQGNFYSRPVPREVAIELSEKAREGE